MKAPKSTRIAHNLMLELAAVRKRLKAAEAVVEAARNFTDTDHRTEYNALLDKLAAYDKLKGGDA